MDSRISDGDQSEWLRKCGVVERDLAAIKLQTDRFDQVVQSIKRGEGDPFGTQDQIHQLTSSTRQLCSEILTLEQLAQGSDEWRVSERKSRTRRLHQAAISELGRIQRLSSALHAECEKARREQRSRQLNTAGLHPGSHAFDPLSSDGNVDNLLDAPRSQNQMTLHQDTIQQEEQELVMRRLESDITQVNEVFTTLATLVHEQDDLVDSIEANTEAAYMQVGQGTQNLAQARVSRNKARRRKFCLIGVGLAVLLIIIIIIAVSLRPSS